MQPRVCFSLHQLLLLLPVLFAWAIILATDQCTLAATVNQGGQILDNDLSNESTGDIANSGPELARNYMDALLADPAAARTKLCGNFTKRSKVAVIYTCFERMEMIQKSLPSVFRSKGIEDFDVFISQDGITTSIFDDETFSIPSNMRHVYIHHPVNLCTGLHMHFVKSFAFDIMGYDILLIVEEDNVLHPQALQLLARMAELSVAEADVGVVSILDMDMSAFLDAGRFGVGLIPVRPTTGHLWVYGIHRVKYDIIRPMMHAYYDVIKGYDYTTKHKPPLKFKIERLLMQHGFPASSPLSQDRFFLNSLAKANFTKRYQTLFRFFEPIGSYGLHFKHNSSFFQGMFGRNMYAGTVDPQAAFDVTKDPRNVEAIRDGVRERLTNLIMKYRKAKPSDELVGNTFDSLMAGRLQGQTVVQNIQGTNKVPPSPPPPPPPQTVVVCTTSTGVVSNGGTAREAAVAAAYGDAKMMTTSKRRLE
ncbi:hypothetical protein VOLCADRAFT_95055 [Volvox carteri f. nagariensis]|uniref:Uncharacterized protein n=1 Tax=Volvox carteri f. nagariensis TaxID=3068 RepID=D8U6H0_VOLCA|nr:uncharacterized protein VOLCADRAFT_95055 [Volvox carteri f. nagariensis]EFJ44646.1 hypothetical protein VOLCADRAFT_95055 [Volvox carteri f. nagariensis]|eukprot:XP_002954222.1 hypothetical protein VOLCADRAFT_95055 [Volvox carteri f. nagariensis]